MTKRILIPVLFIFALITTAPAFAITLPGRDPAPSSRLMLRSISHLKTKDLQQQLGRKLTLKEKIAFFILKKKARAEEKDKGQSAYVAGLIAVGLFVAGLFFAPLLIGSLIAAIVAIATGNGALRMDRKNHRANTGVLLGWITLGLLAVLLLVALLLIATFPFWI